MPTKIFFSRTRMNKSVSVGDILYVNVPGQTPSEKFAITETVSGPLQGRLDLNTIIEVGTGDASHAVNGDVSVNDSNDGKVIVLNSVRNLSVGDTFVNVYPGEIIGSPQITNINSTTNTITIDIGQNFLDKSIISFLADPFVVVQGGGGGVNGNLTVASAATPHYYYARKVINNGSTGSLKGFVLEANLSLDIAGGLDYESSNTKLFATGCEVTASSK